MKLLVELCNGRFFSIFSFLCVVLSFLSSVELLGSSVGGELSEKSL